MSENMLERETGAVRQALEELGFLYLYWHENRPLGDFQRAVAKLLQAVRDEEQAAP